MIAQRFSNTLRKNAHWFGNTRGCEWRIGFADGEVNETKAEASQATLPLDPDLAELLLAHKARSIYPGESDFVFARPDGKPPWPDSIIADHLQPARSTGRIGRVGRSPSAPIVPT